MCCFLHSLRTNKHDKTFLCTSTYKAPVPITALDVSVLLFEFYRSLKTNVDKIKHRTLTLPSEKSAMKNICVFTSTH